jgi:trk system potassium uptake protein
MSTEVTSIKCLTGTDAEVMEFVAKPDSLSTRSHLRDIDFPEGAIIGGIIREGSGYIANGATQIKAGDHVVVFALPEAIPYVGSFFN